MRGGASGLNEPRDPPGIPKLRSVIPKLSSANQFPPNSRLELSMPLPFDPLYLLAIPFFLVLSALATSSKKPAMPRDTAPAKPASSSATKAYLTLYNGVSCGLWAVVLAKVVGTLWETNQSGGIFGASVEKQVWSGTGEYVKWVQTGALLEVAHAGLGLVRAPITTTALQVASRVVLVWGICEPFPSVPASTLWYSSMLTAWSLTEVVRYSYFVFSLNGFVPGILTWLRYNLFFVLYPMGISSEMALVYKSIPEAGKRDERLPYVLWAILGIYFPGAYILYSHMMAQRRRVLRTTKAKAT